jgi:tetratricopeptide (TPR) repeat protein
VFELTTQSFSDDGMTYAAMHYIATGNFKKAHEILTMMRRADPLNEGFRMFYIYTSVLIGDRKGAEAEYERGKSLFGAPWLNGFMVKLGSGIAFEGKLPFDPSKIASDTWARQLFGLIEEYIKSPEEGLKVLRRIYSEDENIGSPELDGISICAAGFGDPEFAMSIIERMVTIDPAALFHIWSPVFHKVRQLPQFKELVREIGLVDYWEQFGWPDICQPTGDGDFECD